MRIDSHQHFWKLERGDYDWLGPELDVLYADHLPADLDSKRVAAGIDRTVVVQAAASVDETRFLLRLAEQTPFIAGVVGWVDMEAGDAVDQLAALATHPLLRGIRPMIQDIPDADWMLRPELAPAFRAVIEHDLCFDALVKPQHLPNLLVLLERQPALRVVIDHGAKPEIARGALEPWRSDLAAIAARTDACCKLSGLVTEAGEDWRAEDIEPYIDSLLELFGPERLMWGSDWPVLNLASDYASWLAMCESILAPLTPAQRNAILGENAARFYRL